METEILPRELRSNEVDYLLVTRKKNWAIYAQSIKSKGRVFAFSVFKIRKKKVGEKWVEIWPAKKDFGQTAWNYCNLGKASERLTLMTKRENPF